MADHIIDAVDSYQPSAGTLLNKLPGRRADAYIREVAAAGMPEKGELTGGYTHAYAHLSHLPLFTLHSDKATKHMQKKWAPYVPENSKTFGQAAPLTVGERATMMYMDHFNGGAPGLMTTGRWMGRVIASLEINAAKMTCEQIVLAQFTRWTLPANVAADLGYGKTPWFVNMLECHWTGEESKRAKIAKVTGNSIQVKPGLPGAEKVMLKFLDLEANGLKSQKGWSKKFKVEEMCEVLILVEGKAEVRMEVVARIPRMCAVPEARAFADMFDKWQVPVLRV